MNADQYCPSSPDPDPLTYARVFSTIAYCMPTHQGNIDIAEWLISLSHESLFFPREACLALNARTRLSAVPLPVVGGTRVNFDDLFAPDSHSRKKAAAPHMEERSAYKLFRIFVNRVTSDGISSVAEECWVKTA